MPHSHPGRTKDVTLTHHFLISVKFAALKCISILSSMSDKNGIDCSKTKILLSSTFFFAWSKKKYLEGSKLSFNHAYIVQKFMHFLFVLHRIPAKTERKTTFHQEEYFILSNKLNYLIIDFNQHFV